MSWRTYLFITTLAFFFSSVQLSGIIYTLINGLNADFTYHVCCFYNGSAPKPWDIRLRLNNRTLDTVSIDESTIGYRINPDQLWYGGWEFQCNWPGNGLTKAVISKYSLLEKFECFYTDIKTEMECSFHHYKDGMTAARLFLAMDNEYKANDISLDDTFVWYKLPYPANFHGSNRNFTIEIDSQGILQKQVYILNDIRMRKPYWPSVEPLIEQSQFEICVDFGSHDFKNSDSYVWKVLLLSPDPRYRLQEATLVSYSDAGFDDPRDVCFKIPSYINDTLEAYLYVRFNHSLSPWTNDNKYLSYTMKQLVPNMPEFLENGLYYDPNKNMIHVFWLELEDLKFSRVNLTYILVTDTGKKPLHQSNSSAVFHDWDPLQPTTISIWSQNSVGRSKKNHTLSVPILRDYKRRQPRNLQYHLEDHTLTWDPPQEEENLSGYYIYSCLTHTNSNNFCENSEQLERNNYRSLWSRSYQFNNDTRKMAVLAKYEDSQGFMKWYGDPEESPNLLGLGIILLIAIPIILALAYLLFQKWKRKKIKEIRISLPPIFDPIVMAKLRLRNVEFPQSRDPPVEIMPSVTVPPRIFFDSIETNAIVGRSIAQLPPSLCPNDSVLSSYMTRNIDPPEVVTSPYTAIYKNDDISSPYTKIAGIQKTGYVTFSYQK